jgi:DNA repair protein RadD
MKVQLREDYQVPAVLAVREHIRAGARRILLNSPTGSGKCLGRGTPVLMADGTVKPVEQVVIGDRLASPTGGFRTVLGIGRGREQLFRVWPTKGDSYVVNSSHLLSVRKTPGSDGLVLADGRHIARDEDTVAVEAGVLFNSNASAKHALKGWRSGVAEFEGAAADLPIPPYVLGMWLGDGTTERPELTKPEGPVVDAWIRWGASLNLPCVREDAAGTRCPTWKLTHGVRGEANPALDALRGIGVLGNKHIPHAYKTASLDDRLQLLAGLLDTDGSVTGSGFDWISVSRELADGMAFLCRSLGLACYITECEKGIRSTGFVGTYWRCSIFGDCDLIPCRQKKAPPRNQKKRHLVHGIELEPLGEGDYFGFEIDGDRLFMLGDFTVTHNTVMGSALMELVQAKGNRANFIVDRLSLIQQTSDTFMRYGLDHGVIQGDHPNYRPSLPIQVCSIQTLAKRGFPPAHLHFIDEAHVLHSAVKKAMAEGAGIFIGLTATPFTKGLAQYFDAVVNVTTTNALIEQGWLSPYRIFSCEEPDMAGVPLVNGEWQQAGASKAALKVVGNVVDEYIARGEGRKFICSAVDTAHVEALASQFLAAGINVATYTYRDDTDDRIDTVAEFRKPDSTIRGLITVTAASRGFDVQDIGCVIEARPLRKGLADHIQLLGRGLRISPETGKVDCLVLDHSGNCARFWHAREHFFEHGIEHLDDGKPKEKKPQEEKEVEPLKCPKCTYLHRPQPSCPRCGHEYPRRNTVQYVPGTLKELVATHNPQMLRKHLWPQVCGFVLASSVSDMAQAQRRAQGIFKELTGEFCKARIETTTPMPPSAELANKIRANRIRFAKGRAKAAAQQGAHA